MRKVYPFVRVILSYMFSPFVGGLIFYLPILFYSYQGDGGLYERLIMPAMALPMVLGFACIIFSPAALIVGVVLVVNKVEKSICSMAWASLGGVIVSGIMGFLIGMGVFYVACLGGISAAVAAFALPSPAEMEKRRQM